MVSRFGWLLGCLAAGVTLQALGCTHAPELVVHDSYPVDDLIRAAAFTSVPESTQALPRRAFKVATVLDTTSKKRLISLQECVAMALENGRVDGQKLKVFAYDPAIAGTEIEYSASRFDARWLSSIQWSGADQPVNTAFQSIQPGLGVPVFVQHAASTGTRLVKPLPTGGIIGAGFSTDYLFSNQDSPINPSYTPAATLTFEQPLLQGYGVELNQLSSSHPGGILQPVQNSAALGLLLTRNLFDKSKADFETRLQDLLLDVEKCYWNLVYSYWVLYSKTKAIHLLVEQWHMEKDKFERNQASVQDLAAIEEQYHLFRAERVSAMGSGIGSPGVLEAERRLRLAVGLPIEDGTRLVPSDTPAESPYQPDWDEALGKAMNSRPELESRRKDLRQAALILQREKNLLLPDLRFLSSYGSNGLGGRLDGAGDNNALRSMTRGSYNNYSLGLNLDVPIGFRSAQALVRKSKLQLTQAHEALKNEEERITSELQRSYRLVIQVQLQIQVFRDRRLAAARQLVARNEAVRAGIDLVPILLIAQRALVDALRDEQQAIAEYNIALADFERQKGTITRHNNISISEGPLPHHVETFAAREAMQLKSGKVLRQRPLSPRPEKALLQFTPPGADELLETMESSLPERLPQPNHYVPKDNAP